MLNIIFRIYLMSVIIELISEMILNARLMKYRKHFNLSTELYASVRNGFTPIRNLIATFLNLVLAFSKPTIIKILAYQMDQNEINIESEEDELDK